MNAITPLKNWSRKLIYFSAGADTTVLGTCSPREKVKYNAIGSMVLLTGIMASISGGYALWTVFEDYWLSIPLALLWGTIVYNIDRLLVISLDHAPTDEALPTNRRYIPLAGRMGLAIIIGVIIARPLELRLFHQEIIAQIVAEKAPEVQSLREQIEARRTMIQETYEKRLGVDPASQELATRTLEVAQLTDALLGCSKQLGEWQEESTRELAGRGLTAIEGDGRVYRRLKSQILEKKSDCAGLESRLDDAQAALTVAKPHAEAAVAAIEGERITQLRSLEHDAKGQMDSLDRSHPDSSFLAKHRALSRLSSEDPTVLAATILIALLFILVEIAPLGAKVLFQQGEYQQKIVMSEGHAAAAWRNASAQKLRAETLLELVKRWRNAALTEADRWFERNDVRDEFTLLEPEWLQKVFDELRELSLGDSVGSVYIGEGSRQPSGPPTVASEPKGHPSTHGVEEEDEATKAASNLHTRRDSGGDLVEVGTLDSLREKVRIVLMTVFIAALVFLTSSSPQYALTAGAAGFGVIRFLLGPAKRYRFQRSTSRDVA